MQQQASLIYCLRLVRQVAVGLGQLERFSEQRLDAIEVARSQSGFGQSGACACLQFIRSAHHARG